jgi:peptidoglycan/xylan/chitin deacetylase (PgdA/CDA1 family)
LEIIFILKNIFGLVLSSAYFLLGYLFSILKFLIISTTIVFFFSEDPKRIVVAFRNDDLSSESDLDHEKAVISIFEEHNIKQTFGFIPKTNPTSGLSNLNEKKRTPIIIALKHWEKEGNIEIALHGYNHLKGLKTSGEFGGLSFEEQYKRIKEGKEIAKELFGVDLDIFIPPYNQADKNTYKACVDSGIKVISGFWGEGPLWGLNFVNGNASLFKTDYYNENKSKTDFILDAETLFNFSQNTKGTAFVIIFYHSRTDFNAVENYLKLDVFLKNLSHHPLVEISSINQIHKKYKKPLAKYNMANTHIYSSIRTMSYAKPHLKAARLMKLNIKKLDSINTNLDNALKNIGLETIKMQHISLPNL